LLGKQKIYVLFVKF